MADIEFNEVRHAKERRQVSVVESVTGIDFETERMRPGRAGNQALELRFPRALVSKVLGISAVCSSINCAPSGPQLQPGRGPAQ